MSLFGVQINTQLNTLILNIRLFLANTKHHANFRTIYRSFAQSDPQITGLISIQIFQQRLNDNGIFFKKSDMQVFAKAYGNQQGFINWFTFLGHLRQPMGPIRREYVQQIFTKIAEGKNEIQVQQLQKYFIPDDYDDFKRVTKKYKLNFQNFIHLFPIQNNTISKQQFINYYDDININFLSDQAFIRYLSHQWHAIQKPIQKTTQQQIIFAIKSLRYKLIQKTNGTGDEFLLHRIFTQFVLNKNNAIGAYELDIMLKKLQVPQPSKMITPLLYHLDKNKSGYIQFDQFKQLVFFQPFAK